MPEDPVTPPRRVTPLDTPSINRRTVLRFPLTEPQVTAQVRAALDEDGAFIDITTIATVLSDRRARARLVARDAGVVAGLALAIEAFHQLDDKVSIRVDAEDGTRVAKGDTVLFLSGHARGLLSAERVALNFLQRLSGVATLTCRYVDAVKGTRARILDTRKTTPGWRALEKYAVRCGGGVNHRFDLSSSVLIKDNHLAAVEGDVGLAVRRARDLLASGGTVEVECDRIEQVRAALAARADIILLDNMPTALMRECVQLVDGRAITEASGGVSLDTVRAIALTGVDHISVGALTHSAPALNLALDFE
ncbi:MAG TPA: carboxylating nicotinate-nucleotide diphosphorylase [Gemmatimonadaceae bacterium]|nr:carboxylating nicotinate-nucleotide diphosphorylase [Gemmatimonadaceae bacterium]